MNKKIPSGTHFYLTDLFNSFQWESLTRGQKISIAKEFSKNVKSNVFKNIELCPRVGNRQYIKPVRSSTVTRKSKVGKSC